MHAKITSKVIFLAISFIGIVFSALVINTPFAFAGAKDSLQPALASIDELMQHGHYEEALPILNGVIDRSTQINEAYAMRGECYYRLEEFEPAIRDFREYFERVKEPAPINYHRYYGLSLYQLRKYTEALEQFTIDIKRKPKVWDFWYDRTQLYTQIKQYDKALSDANVLVSLRPDYVRYALRAKIYRYLGNYQKSAEDWTVAIKKAPDFLAYYEERARCYDKLGKAKLAAEDRKKRDAGCN